MITVGHPIVFGHLPDLPISLPQNVTWWRIRCRPDDAAYIYMRINGNFEKWLLEEKDGKITPWMRVASNIRSHR